MKKKFGVVSADGHCRLMRDLDEIAAAAKNRLQDRALKDRALLCRAAFGASAPSHTAQRPSVVTALSP